MAGVVAHLTDSVVEMKRILAATEAAAEETCALRDEERQAASGDGASVLGQILTLGSVGPGAIGYAGSFEGDD